MKKSKTIIVILCMLLLAAVPAGCSSGTTWLSTDSDEDFFDTTFTVDVAEVGTDDDMTSICFKESGSGYFAEITDDTELTDAGGNSISVDDIEEGDSVTITTDEDGFAILIVLNEE